VMTGFSEAIGLGRALGLDEKFLLDTILGGPLAAPYLGGKRAKIEGRSFEADFPLKLLYKDVQLATTSGYERGMPLAASAAVRELCALACRDGRGDDDFSAIYAWVGDASRAAGRST
jgi:3-hydroxyisobutyrate dehydrogenase-like beta-hydroxyacid dehydrogenase